MKRRNRMPFVLGIIWIGVVAVVVVVQRGANRENEFVVWAQQKLASQVSRYPGVLSVRCTGRTVFVDVRKGLSRRDVELISRTWAGKYSQLRQEKLGDGKVTATLMEELDVVCHAHARNGEAVSVEYVRE